MKRALPVLAAATVALAALAAPASTATVVKSVSVGDNYFVRDGSAPIVAVRRNTRVKWLWRGDSPHNVVVTRGPVKFRSRSMREGSYSKLMTTTGSYRIVCTIHGAGDQSMTLRVS